MFLDWKQKGHEDKRTQNLENLWEGVLSFVQPMECKEVQINSNLGGGVTEKEVY